MEKLSPNTKIQDGSQSYTLLEYIGSGSYGEVWKARNDASGGDVAIKFYIMLDEKGREEFMSEYEIAYGLTHRNLLTASYIGTWENRPFLVMRYCPQGSSVKLIGQLTPNGENEKVLWRFIHDVASGLAYLHDVEPDPIVHQDIKPDNILQDNDGGFVITDFGISKKIRSTMRSQSTRAVKAGAVAYMGPERFSSQPTPIMASDIWSLGASIYELAEGELPFCGQGGNMLRNGADMPDINSGWSEDLKKIIYSCLSKEPWDRMRAFEIAEFAQAKLDGGSSTSAFDPRKTVRKVTADFTEEQEKKNEANDEIDDAEGGSVRKHKKKSHTGAWVGGFVGAICLFFAIYVGTEDRRDARAHISQYQSMVSKCSSNIDKGSSDYSVLFDAVNQIEEIEKWENRYSQYFPDVFNQSTSLNDRLKQKRADASEAWAKSAKSQKRLGENSKAIEYYRLANKLSGSNTYNSEIESIAKAMGYMKIKNIELRNYDDDKEISAYGSTIKASDARWIQGRVLYDGVLNESKTIPITIKIYKPNGELMTGKYDGKDSPAGCSFVQNNVSIKAGTGNYWYISAWGNAKSSCYDTGTYRYEVWYNGNKLFSKKIQFQ